MMRSIFIFFSLLSVLCIRAQNDTMEVERAGHWGCSMEMGPGTGIFFWGGEAKDKITDGYSYSNIGIGITYDRFHLMIRSGGIHGTLKSDLQYSPEWTKANQFFTSHIQLNLGYELICTRHFNVIPYGSGGLIGYDTRRDTVGKVGVGTAQGWSYSAGIAFDYKLNFPMNKKNREPGIQYGMNYLYVRLLTGVYPSYLQNPFGINGFMCFTNLSLGLYLSGRREIPPRAHRCIMPYRMH